MNGAKKNARLFIMRSPLEAAVALFGRPYKFRIYPERRQGSRLYFEVVVHRTLKELRRISGVDASTYAITKMGRKIAGGTGHKTNCLGVIHLSFDHLGVRVVAHEIVHATLYYLAVRNHQIANAFEDQNERVAYIVGDLTSDLYQWIYDHIPGAEPGVIPGKGGVRGHS